MTFETHAETADESGVPAVVRHLAPAGLEPRDVLDVRTADRAPPEEPPPPQHGLVPADANETPRELQELALRRREVPIRPGDLVVLTVGVVVAALRPSDFVSSADHGDALGQQQRSHQVSLLPLAK